MQLCFLVTNTSEVHHTTQKQAETYILADYRLQAPLAPPAARCEGPSASAALNASLLVRQAGGCG